MKVSIKVNLGWMLLCALAVVLISALTPIAWPWAIVIMFCVDQLVTGLVKHAQQNLGLKGFLRVQRFKRALKR